MILEYLTRGEEFSLNFTAMCTMQLNTVNLNCEDSPRLFVSHLVSCVQGRLYFQQVLEIG